MVRIFQTAQQLITFIASLPRTDSDHSDEESAVWFCCMQEAKNIINGYNTKDTANLFLNGIVGYKHNPRKSIGNFLDTILDEFNCTREGCEDEYPIMSTADGLFVSDVVAEMCDIVDLVSLINEHYNLNIDK